MTLKVLQKNIVAEFHFNDPPLSLSIHQSSSFLITCSSNSWHTQALGMWCSQPFQARWGVSSDPFHSCIPEILPRYSTLQILDREMLKVRRVAKGNQSEDELFFPVQ